MLLPFSDMRQSLSKRKFMNELETFWNDILFTFGRITIASMFLPIIIGFLYIKNWGKAIYVAFFYCICTLLTNIFEQVLVYLIDHNTDFFLPYLNYWEIDNTFFLAILYYLKDFLIIGWFFSLILPFGSSNKYILWISWLLAFASFFNYCFIEGYKVYGVFNPTADAFFMIILPLVYLWFSQKQSLRIPLRKNPYFWICIGLVVPNLFTLFLYFTGSAIYEKDFVLYAKLYSIKNLFEIISQFLISYGFINSYNIRFIEPSEENAPA